MEPYAKKDSILNLLGLLSYAGFLTVNPEFESNLYFWFFPSQSDPSKDPVILWLQVSFFKYTLVGYLEQFLFIAFLLFKGGPGATSLFGQFKENGPIKAYAVDKPIKGPEEEAELKKLKEQKYPFPMYNMKKPFAKLNPYSWNRYDHSEFNFYSQSLMQNNFWPKLQNTTEK